MHNPDERIPDSELSQDTQTLLRDFEAQQVEFAIEIDDLRHSQEALEESHRTYSELYDQAPIGYFVFDRAGVTISANLTGAAMLGQARHSVVGARFSTYVVKEDRTQFRRHLDEAFDRGDRVTDELCLIGAGGSVLYVELQSVASAANEGVPAICRTTIIDITERKQAEEALRESEARLQATLQSAADEIWITDAEARIVLISDSVKKNLGVRSGQFEDVAAALGELDILLPDGTPRPVDEAPLLLALRGEVVGSQQEMIRNLATGELRWREASSAPITDSQGNIIGAIAIARDIQDRKRDEEKLSADLDALTHMHALSGTLLSAQGLQPLLQEIMDAAVAIVGAQLGTLQLIEGDSLRIVAHHGHAPAFLQFFRRAESRASVCGEARKSGGRVVVRDIERSPLFEGTDSLAVLVAAGVRAVQSTPLTTRTGALLGILTTQWSAPYDPDEHDLWRIDLLARQAADLIETARAEEDLKAAYERERHISVTLQRAIIPAEPHISDDYPTAAVYIPAYAGEEVGGDFYDIFPLDDGRVGILIGDVSGKGVEAASLATMTHSTVRAMAHVSESPGEALFHANEVLCTAQPANSFVTAHLAFLDVSTGCIVGSSAGHPPPAVLRASGRVVFLIVSNAPLGVVEKQVFDDEEYRLDPGDAVVLYTDGVDEARRDGNLFGCDGIERALMNHAAEPPKSICDELLSAVKEWADDTLRDDTAIVVIQRRA